MKSLKKFCYAPAFALLTLFIVSGCMTTKEKPAPEDPRVIALLAVLKNHNDGLKTFNGQGAISITEQSRTRSYRLAWAAENPDRIRLIVLFSGKPIETLAADGHYLYLKSHTGGHVPIKRQRKNPSLEPFIAVPLTTGQITCFLSGKVPIPDYRSARLEKTESGKGSLLRFYENDTTVIQTVSFDDNDRVLGYDVTESRNTRYTVTLGQADELHGFVFPREIQVTQNNRSCLIHVESNTPNPELPPDTFVIIP